MILSRVSPTVKTLTRELVDCRHDEDRFATLAATMADIIPSMSDAEANYVLKRLNSCLPNKHSPLLSLWTHENRAWRQEMAADLIVMLRRRGA